MEAILSYIIYEMVLKAKKKVEICTGVFRYLSIYDSLPRSTDW